jgi:hypothetical protein
LQRLFCDIQRRGMAFLRAVHQRLGRATRWALLSCRSRAAAARHEQRTFTSPGIARDRIPQAPNYDSTCMACVRLRYPRDNRSADGICAFHMFELYGVSISQDGEVTRTGVPADGAPGEVVVVV